MKQGILKDVAQLMRYRLANAAAQAKNFNEWLSDRSVVAMHGQGHAPHRINQQIETMIEREDVNLAVAVRNIADAIAWLPLDVFESEVGEDGRQVLTPATEHPFVALWREPNEKHSTTDIILHLVMSWLLSGNAYLHIQRGEQRGNVLNPLGDVSLWPIPSWHMFVKRDKDGRAIGYTQNPRAWNEINYELDEIVHFMQYNPVDPIYGRSGLEPLKRQLWTEYQAELMMLGFFMNDGTPRAVFIPEEDVGPTQSAQIEEFYGGRANPDDKNRLQVMPMKGELKTVTPSMKDMEFIQMRKYNRERTYAMMGLPPFLGGDMEHANFANAKMQDESFWRNRLMPISKKMADTLMRQLLWRMGDKSFILKHDTTKVEALQGDKLKKARTNSLLISGGIMSQNEVRVMEYDLERIDTPEADEIQVHRTNAGGDDSNPPVAGAPSGGDKRLNKKVTITTKSATGQVIDTKAIDKVLLNDAWNKFNQVVLDNEPVLIKALKKFYKGQLKRVLDALVTTTIQGRFMSQLAPSIRTKDDGHIDFFLNISEEEEIMTNLFSPIIRDLMEKIGTEQSGSARSANQSGIGIDFDVDNPQVQVVIHNLTNRMANTNDKTFKDIRRILKRAFGDGSSVQDVAKQITAKFKEYSLSRSKTIARTEMTGIANSASNHAWQGWGATHKTWVATLDDLTRDYHVQYNGERVAINDSYKFGPEPLLYPGDPNASLAANVINCRCTEVYDFDPLTQQELTDLEMSGLAAPGNV